MSKKFNGNGEDNPNAKLTGSEVAQIRIYYALGYSIREISQIFGVSAGHVSKIARKVYWN